MIFHCPTSLTCCAHSSCFTYHRPPDILNYAHTWSHCSISFKAAAQAEIHSSNFHLSIHAFLLRWIKSDSLHRDTIKHITTVRAKITETTNIQHVRDQILGLGLRDENDERSFRTDSETWVIWGKVLMRCIFELNNFPQNTAQLTEQSRSKSLAGSIHT